jgi:hypothetical protein
MTLSKTTLSIAELSVIMLSATFLYCYAKCRFAEWHFAEWHFDEWCGTIMCTIYFNINFAYCYGIPCTTKDLKIVRSLVNSSYIFGIFLFFIFLIFSLSGASFLHETHIFKRDFKEKQIIVRMENICVYECMFV